MAPIRLLCSATAVVGLALCAACTAAAPPASSSPAPASAAAPADPDTDAECAALPPFDAVVFTYPSGGDPDAPKPSADALKQWAGTAVGPVTALADAAPAELAAPVATLRAAIDGAAQGTPVDPADQEITAAATAVDKWGYDHCGFGTLDVTGTGTELPGVPATLPAGPLAVKFDNGGDPATKGSCCWWPRSGTVRGTPWTASATARSTSTRSPTSSGPRSRRRASRPVTPSPPSPRAATWW
jgi:hypothetical protein